MPVKKIIKKYAANFTYFYQYLRYRIFVVLALNMGVGILDGFGLAMFLPLLQMVNGDKEVDAGKLGKMHFIVDGMKSIGVPFTLVSVLVLLCIFFTLKGIVRYFSDSYVITVQQLFVRKIRLNILAQLNAISFKSFTTSDVGIIQNTMSGEVDKVSRAFASYFKSVEQVILAAVYMSFAFFVSAQFALLVIAGGFITNLVYRKIYNDTKESSRKGTADANAFQGLIIQHVANFKYLKASGRLGFFGERLKVKLLELEKSNKRIGVLSAIVAGAREPLMLFVVSAVIIIQIYFLGASLGPILISLLFFYRALTAVVQMQTAWNFFLGNFGSIENMTSFQKYLAANKETTGKKEANGFTNSINLKNITVSYGDRQVLKNITLKINKNETVAFAGESGSGKSTLVNVLACLLPADEGVMEIDGINRTEIEPVSFQNKIGYITQEPVIFNDSIFNNVTFWDNPTPENIKRFNDAIKKAALKEFIENLPAKENTELGNNGINISGGQKQRISIARELYKDIEILIMDEATSALDSETERFVQDKIDELKGQYTIIIVAHRLSTIKNADRIVLMRNGEIEQTGTYQQLIDNTSLFKRMVELQEL